MTGQEILDYLCGTSTQDAFLESNEDDAKFRKLVLAWLELTFLDLSNKQQTWHWRFLETTWTMPTVANQHSYDPPTSPALNTNKAFALYDRTKNRTYRFVRYDKFVRRVPNPANNSGDSFVWTFWAGTFRLYPVPDSVFTVFLDGIKQITTPGDSSTKLVIPDVYKKVVIDGILTLAYKFDKDLGDAPTQEIIYAGGVDRMVRDNAMSIAEKGLPESHRDKFFFPGTGGKNSIFFPHAEDWP